MSGYGIYIQSPNRQHLAKESRHFTLISSPACCVEDVLISSRTNKATEKRRPFFLIWLLFILLFFKHVSRNRLFINYTPPFPCFSLHTTRNDERKNAFTYLRVYTPDDWMLACLSRIYLHASLFHTKKLEKQGGYKNKIEKCLTLVFFIWFHLNSSRPIHAIPFRNLKIWRGK